MHPMTREPTPPRYPTVLSLFGHGSQVSICGPECMDELEGEWYPGIRFSHMTEHVLQTETCAHCVVCGRATVKPRYCRLHDAGCPGAQWAHTLEGMSAATLAFELFGRVLGDRVRLIVEAAVSQRPDTDPTALIYRMWKNGQ